MNNKIYFLFIFVLIFVFLFSLSSCFAKSYTLDNANVSYYIENNAKVNVSESITFNFKGDFTFAYRELPKGNYDISDIKVFDENNLKLQYDLENEYDKIKITWYYNASDEIKTFKVNYVLNNVINSYTDYSEFNWKIWGQEWDHSLKEINASIYLPGNTLPETVYVWGHPQINGKIGMLDNNKIIAQAFDISANQFVELHIAFPSSLLLTKDYANSYSKDGLQSIIDSEDNYYSNTKTNNIIYYIWFIITIISMILFIVSNAISKVYSRVITFANVMRIIFIVLIVVGFIRAFIEQIFISWHYIALIVFILLQLLLFFVLWIIFGREPKVNLNSIYERDIPYNYSPAVVSALMNISGHKPSDESVVAELLNLCLKKKIKLDEIKKKNIFSSVDFAITIINSSTKDLSESEALLLELLIDASKYEIKGFFNPELIKDNSPNYLTIEQLKEYLSFIENGKSKGYEFMTSWRSSVQDYSEKLKFYDKQKWVWPYIILSLLLLIISLFINKYISLTLLILALGIVFIFNNVLPRRTTVGATHYTKWVNLKKYLNDFSNFNEKKVQDIALWERYLVYAIPLGCADKVRDAIKLNFSETKLNSNSSFIFTTSSLSSFNSFSSSFSSAFSSASSTSGSSGFSGGSSGGGGGGGGGAG